SPLAINDCVFLQNRADRAGGLYASGNGGRTEIRGTLFESNTAAIFSGGMDAYETGLTVSHCVFRGNVAQTHGGGLTVWNSGFYQVRTLITDSVFTENSAAQAAGLQV